MTNGFLEVLINNLHDAQNSNSKINTIKALYKLAEYNYNKENYYKAKLLFQEILLLNSKLKNINFHISLCEINLDKLNEAKTSINKELKINPNNYKAKQIKEKLYINSNIPLITITLVILNLLVFIYTFPQISLEQLIKYGAYNSQINIINLFTSIFFHINLIHLASNMIFLVLFGLVLEKNIGSGKFLIIYIISGIFGNLSQAIIIPESIVIGASSALFGITAALIMRQPLLEIRLLGFIKTKIIIAYGCFFAISNLILEFININIYSTGELAHLFGFMAGILIIGIFYQDSIEVFYNWLIIFISSELISYSIRNIISNFEIFEILYSSLLFITGILAILYSYDKLKLMINLKLELELNKS